MPRTSKVELPGCPRLRLLCCDSLGLIKVIEAEAEGGAPTVVQRWGQPDPRRAIRCISLSTDSAPRLAVARKTNIVEILGSGTGTLHCEVLVPGDPPTAAERGAKKEDDSVCGIHLLKDNDRCSVLLTCSDGATATLQRLTNENVESVKPQAQSGDVVARWSVSQNGSVLCMAMDAGEEYVVFGGNGVDVNLWDAAKGSKVWSAKAPHRDNLGLIPPTLVTAVTFLSADDHRKIVTGTANHQVRLYDIAAQRRPTLSFDYGESMIKTVTRDPDGHSVFVGTGGGDLGCFDMRMGRLIGGFKGKCAGSVRSVARHPVLPLIASCGLDRYLRIHNTKTRQLLASLFLKQQLAAVVFDVEENISAKASAVEAGEGVSDLGDLDILTEDMEVELVAKRKRVKPVEKMKRVRSTARTEQKGASFNDQVNLLTDDELESLDRKETVHPTTAGKKASKLKKRRTEG